MSWYDYIPVAGSIARLAQGDYKQAGIDAIPIAGPLAQAASNKEDQYANGLDYVHHELMDLADRSRNFQMQGLDKAEGYFAPAQARLDALYGPPGAFKK